MKKLLFIAFFAAFASAVSAQTIKFDSETINYGVVEKGAEGVRVFKFKNEGKAPLLIENAQGSCGCTVPTYSKEPIMPGATGEISVKYDTNREGAFTKYVTLTTNSTTGTTTRLTITGEVKPAATPVAPK
jgi:hypothetical protein